jgi:hypothetical protein
MVRTISLGISCRIKCPFCPAIRPQCRYVHGAASVTNGPLPPLATTSKCCSAARHCGHSCILQHFCWLKRRCEDEAAFCSCGYCWRSICSRTQHGNFGGAAIFTEAAIQTSARERKPNRTFAALYLKSKDAGQSGRILSLNRRQLTCQKTPLEILVRPIDY